MPKMRQMGTQHATKAAEPVGNARVRGLSGDDRAQRRGLAPGPTKKGKFLDPGQMRKHQHVKKRRKDRLSAMPLAPEIPTTPNLKVSTAR
ncbi:MAG: hypothetical protein AAGE13_04275, partial [Pseudomonadota bacterium]